MVMVRVTARMASPKIIALDRVTGGRKWTVTSAVGGAKRKAFASSANKVEPAFELIDRRSSQLNLRE
jgi:hypothetical protein